MRSLCFTTAILAFSVSPSFADELSHAPVLQIENFIGTLIVNTGESHALAITKAKNDGGVLVKNNGNVLSIDGGVTRPDGNKCSGHYTSLNIQWSAKSGIKKSQSGGYKNLKDYPKLTISAPDNAHLIIRNAIPFMATGDVGSTDINLKSCGQIDMEDIKGGAQIRLNGTSDMSADDIEWLDIDIRGSGDFEGGDIGAVTATSTGSGDIALDDIKSGEFRLSGSGDIEVGDIRGPLTVISRGSGDFSGDIISGDVSYESRGSGDFDIETVNGNVLLNVTGSGNVDIDAGSVETLRISAFGSSDIDFGGVAKDAIINATGASDVFVYKVTGDVSKRESGASDITIRNR